MFQHQAVLVVAGCSSEHLLPLNTTGLPPALLPVANQPLITYPLHTLESGGVHDVLVVRRATLERVSLALVERAGAPCLHAGA
jgi:NDP-sugar pyrophosphorylase family protein